MNNDRHQQEGFNSTRQQMDRWRSYGTIPQRLQAHEIWLNLGSTDSPYTDGCRKALRLYFVGGRPNARLLRDLHAQRKANA